MTVARANQGEKEVTGGMQARGTTRTVGMEVMAGQTEPMVATVGTEEAAIIHPAVTAVMVGMAARNS